jgi:putative membrane protein
MTLQDFLIKTLVDAIIVLAGAYLLSGVHVDGFGYAILVALALAILNQFVKPLLIIFTIPATILTLGLFLLVINAVIIIMADWIVSGFQVDSFWWALSFSLVLTLFKSLFDGLYKDRSETERRDY